VKHSLDRRGGLPHYFPYARDELGCICCYQFHSLASACVELLSHARSIGVVEKPDFAHVRTLRPLESRGSFRDPQRARYPLSARAIRTTPLRSVLAAFGPRRMILPRISGEVPYWNSTCPVRALTSYREFSRFSVSILHLLVRLSVEQQLSSELERQTNSTLKDKQNAIHGHRQSHGRHRKRRRTP
jgi:hypothetical protein